MKYKHVPNRKHSKKSLCTLCKTKMYHFLPILQYHNVSYILPGTLEAPIVFRKNLNAAKPPEQSKGLGGNIDCKDKESSIWY